MTEFKPSEFKPSEFKPSEEWNAKTPERGYHHCDGVFVKRSLRPSEYVTSYKGGLHIPRLGIERLQNEAESLRFLRRFSNIPVPTLYAAFEVDGAFFLIMEYIEGIGMSALPEDQKQRVWPELQQYITALHELKSHKLGGIGDIVIPPCRVLERTGKDSDSWPRKESQSQEYVFCHNDLSQHNIIVDPDTLKIKAIIDWEYAGFFPEYFEASFYKRIGPSSALDGEPDDVPLLLDFLRS
ncbi:uncharacterized protein N7483_002475 [Penicillium malachiteum]|uniref:uncharacterized protein n=1 Tax=Penicillium malachiteum TaxID=1324776 RepID=UPI0025499F7F|nr:uncharacterized protein N7483_002475 [Penicillium malachiteum]KAJ5737350.1 hypothetical protein N7483_002475 [Penicillium malachiteum]